jgi:hypothetical protein
VRRVLDEYGVDAGGGAEGPLLIGHECFRVVTCVQVVVITDGDAYGNPARAGEGPGGQFGGKPGTSAAVVVALVASSAAGVSRSVLGR